MDDDDIELWNPGPMPLTVYVTDPVELGRLYGADGEVVSIIWDRDWVPFGFQGTQGGAL